MIIDRIIGYGTLVHVEPLRTHKQKLLVFMVYDVDLNHAFSFFVFCVLKI